VLSSAHFLEWFRQMCMIRTFEKEIHGLNNAGLVCGTAHLYIGMEAIAVGACAAMREDDYLTSTHRGHGHCLARGLDPSRMMAEVLGRADGYCRGKGGSMHIADISLGVLGADGIVGGGIPIAVGAAYALQLKKQNSVVICFFGDGASNQGSFHEALNLAAIRRIPVVFVCENNQWALSASFSETTAGGSVAKRAASYGLVGQEIDGNDVNAVFIAVYGAVERARQGLGPTVIECQSYRWEGHSIFTRQEIRKQEEIDEWKQRDPILRWRNKLLESNSATPELLASVENQVQEQMNEAVRFAKNSPPPEPFTAFEDVYA
jgi:TPP-dependent pyruvate/acetoin dehydrogenase alpha subunit